jgi:hypothetical protein
VNLITLSIKPCYTLENTFDYREKCSVLDFVFGRIPDGRTADSRCLANVNTMYTLIMTMSSESDLAENQHLLRSRLGINWSANYYLVFISENKTVAEIMCNFTFGMGSKLLECFEIFDLVDALTNSTAHLTTTWYTSIEVQYSPSSTAVNNFSQRQSFIGQNVDEFLMVETLKKANESAAIVYTDNAAQMSIESQYKTLMYSTVLVDEMTNQFISCFEKPTLKFQMYVKPFNIGVWISLFLCCSLITILMYIYNRIFRLSGSFCPILFFVSALLGASYSIPYAIWNSKIFKVISTCWLLTGILFTNLYIGLMISDVTAPVQGEIYNTFEKILGMKNESTMVWSKIANDITTFWAHNYTNTVKLNGRIPLMYTKGCDRRYIRDADDQYDSSGYERHHAQFRTSESFAILQTEVEKCEGFEVPDYIRKRFLSHPWMYKLFDRLYQQLTRFKPLLNDTSYFRRLNAFFSPQLRHYPKDPKFPNKAKQKIEMYPSAAIEKELVACERSIFVGNRKEINAELAYLKTNYPRKRFYTSNDTFEKGWSTPIIWSFKGSGKSKVPRYFKLLLEAGIRNGVTGLRKHKYYLKRRTGTQFIQEYILREPSPGMAGSIQTIFIISIASLSLGFLVFLLEVVYFKFHFFFFCKMLGIRQWAISQNS